MIWLDMKTSYRVTHRVCQGKELLEDQQRRTDQLEAQLAHLQDWRTELGMQLVYNLPCLHKFTQAHGVDWSSIDGLYELTCFSFVEQILKAFWPTPKKT